MLPPAYGPPEELFRQDVSSAVENTMKKHTDNVMRFLEGLSSRLSQLELYCYNVDKSIGEMRSDLERDCSEADLKRQSLDKHLQEVHRSVQILKDKQELAETQKELSKLQLAQKETSSASNSQLNERSASSTPDYPKKVESLPNMQGMELALALPHQLKPVEQQQAVASRSQNVIQSTACYVPAQLHYMQSDSNGWVPQAQDMPRIVPPPAQSQANQMSPQLQQQWLQQLPPQMPQRQQMTPLQSSLQTQARPQLTAVYPQYPPSQPSNPSPESIPNSMPMQMPYPGVSQPGAGHAEAMSYVFMGPNRTMQQQPPHQKPHYGYVVYEGESGRPHNPLQPQQSHFPQGGYPPSDSLQGPQATAGANILVCPPQLVHGHPHGEVIEKLVNMGYRVDHISSVVQRLEESGQPVNFNAVLDRLKGHSFGGSQGGWSG